VTQPTEGPIHERWGPYIRNIQPIDGTPLFIADACRGVKGKGRIWYPLILAPNPNAGKPSWINGPPQGEWLKIGCVKEATGCRQGLLKASLYGRKDPVSDTWCRVEAFLPDSEAVHFLIYAAKKFWI